VGVGGGMELLQFAPLLSSKGGVVGVDVVDEVFEASHKENFLVAESKMGGSSKQICRRLKRRCA
jgi:hypothetical protein